MGSNGQGVFSECVENCRQISLVECRENPNTRLFQDLLRLIAPLLRVLSF